MQCAGELFRTQGRKSRVIRQQGGILHATKKRGLHYNEKQAALSMKRGPRNDIRRLVRIPATSSPTKAVFESIPGEGKSSIDTGEGSYRNYGYSKISESERHDTPGRGPVLN